MHASGGIAGLERQALAGPVAWFDRLGAEAIVDVAAEGLDIKIRRGLAGEIQLNVAADGLTVNLRIGSGAQRCGKAAGYALESSVRHSPQGQPHIAADGRSLDIGIPAGQHDATADGLHLDPLRRHRRKMNIAAHIIGAQVPAAVAAEYARAYHELLAGREAELLAASRPGQNM